MSIADNIKRLRETYGITQEELGAIAGVSDKAVSKWELGYAEPRMGAVQRIADHFHVSKASLLEDYDTKTELEKMMDKAFSDRPEMRMLFSVAEKSTKEDIEKTIKILEALRAD